MKNIHVLPTDKPSRLWINNLLQGKLVLSKEFLVGSNTSQNIYITNDGEIKDGEYGICLNLVREGFKSHQAVFKMDAEQRQAMNELGGQKKAEVLKVILTTDQDLIKDGVQAIDDAFLEWFVKNPSCEEVKIEKVLVTNSGLGHQEYAVLDSSFKVIEINAKIPQTSYSLGKVTILDSYEYVVNYKIIIPKEEPKDETLEEAAGTYYPSGDVWTEEEAVIRRLAFKNGVKWQAERMYSEEDMIEFAKWIFLEVGSNTGKDRTNKELFNEWFEQFKKK